MKLLFLTNKKKYNSYTILENFQRRNSNLYSHSDNISYTSILGHVFKARILTESRLQNIEAVYDSDCIYKQHHKLCQSIQNLDAL